MIFYFEKPVVLSKTDLKKLSLDQQVQKLNLKTIQIMQNRMNLEYEDRIPIIGTKIKKP